MEASLQMFESVVVQQSDVLKLFRGCNTYKSPGPDKIRGHVLKHCAELVKSHILSGTQKLLDPFQFAYQPSRGVDDAILTLLNMVYRHLEGATSHVRVLFVDFSSAFNTIQPYILAQRLIQDFSLDGGLVLWLLDFLSHAHSESK